MLRTLEGFENALKNPKYLNADSLLEKYKSNELYNEAMSLVSEKGKAHYSAEWLAAKLMDGDKVVADMLENKNAAYAFIEKAKNGSLITSDCKFEWIGSLLDGTVTKTKKTSELLTKFDRNAIHPKKGKWVAIGIIIAALCCLQDR